MSVIRVNNVGLYGVFVDKIRAFYAEYNELGYLIRSSEINVTGNCLYTITMLSRAIFHLVFV